MANHVAKITPPRQPPTSPHKYTVHRTGEDWVNKKNCRRSNNLSRTNERGHLTRDGKYQEYRHLIKGPEKPKKTREMENEIRRLFQGIIDIEGTGTCLFIRRHKVPQDIKVTYIRIVCDIIPQNKETHRVLPTVRGNKITYYGSVSTPTEYLTMDKIHWNIVLYTLDRKYLIVDVKNFYLKNPTKKAEYYNIEIKLIPQDIIDKYDLNNKQRYGYIYIRYKKGMYGLVQSGIIAH